MMLNVLYVVNMVLPGVRGYSSRGGTFSAANLTRQVYSMMNARCLYLNIFMIDVLLRFILNAFLFGHSVMLYPLHTCYMKGIKF